MPRLVGALWPFAELGVQVEQHIERVVRWGDDRTLGMSCEVREVDAEVCCDLDAT